MTPIQVTPEQFEGLAGLYNQLTHHDRIAELTQLRSRIQKVNGSNSKFERIIDSLLAVIHEQDTPQDLLVKGIKNLSLKNEVACSPTVRRFLLRRDVQRTADMFEELFSYQKKTPSDTVTAFLSALRKTSHFFEMQQADERLLSQDLVKRGVDPEKVKAVSFATVSHSMRPFAEFIARGLSYKAVEDCSGYDSMRYSLWLDFFLANDEPCTISLLSSDQVVDKVTIPREHSALIFGEKELGASMVIAQNDCKQKDKQGYGPAHFAALFSSWDALVLLKKLGADFTAQTSSGASVYDLLHARGHSISKLPKTIPVFKDSVLEVSAIQRLFSRGYAPTSFHSTKTLCEFWINKVVATKIEELPSFRQQLFVKYLQIKRSGVFYVPPVYVERVDGGAEGTKPQYVLKASRDIAPGEFIMECAGELMPCLHPADAEQEPYSAGGIPGLQVNPNAQSNFSEFICQGPPICDVFAVVIAGRYHVLCYSVMPIAKGSPLYINYGKSMTHKDAGSTEPAARIIDQYIEGSERLTHFFQGVQVGRDVWRTIIFRVQDGIVDEFLVDSKPPQNININQLRLHIQHHRLMLEYLYKYPRHLLDRLDNKSITIDMVLFAMEAYKKVLKKEGDFDEDYHETLIRQILVFYQLSSKQKLSLDMFKGLLD